MKWPRTRPGCIDYYGMAIDSFPLGRTPSRRVEISSAVDSFEFEWAGELLEREDRAVVAGCGYGSVAAWVASLLGVDRIVAYEPNLEVYRAARELVRVEGKPLRIVLAALAATSERRLFWRSKRWPQSSLVPDFIPEENRLWPEYVQTVDVNRAVAEHSATALLLDVEGAEHEILPVLDFSPLRMILTELHGTVQEVEPLERLINGAGLETVCSKSLGEDGDCRWHIVGAVRPEAS